MKKENSKEISKNINKEVIKDKDKIKNFAMEFKTFISKGNVVDMAVGVIIGSAFGKIVTSLVNDIFMPLIGIIIGGVDFTNLTLKVKDASINYGMFIQNIIDFLIVAFCIFVFVKILNKLSFMKKEAPCEKEAPKKDENTLLLEEIRDILKSQNKR